MSIGPLFSELAQSGGNSLFSKIGTVLIYALLLVGGVIAIVSFIKLWSNRYQHESERENGEGNE